MGNEEFKDIGNLLKHAIMSEIEGYNFYDLLSKKAKNKDAIRRLENLRDDEKRHREVLTNMYREIVGGEPGTLPLEGISPLSKAFDAGNLKKFNSEIEYIDLAIKAELAATQFYKVGAELMDRDEFKKLLTDLSDEENSHYELLKAEREALTGNYFWFSTDGTSPMED
jgi:rubrerythrin